MPSLVVSGAEFDLSKREAQVDSASLTGIKLVTWLEPDGSFNLLRLALAPPGAASPTAPAPGAAPPAVAPVVVAPAGGPPPQSWTFALRELGVREASISAEDRSTSPAVKVLLAPLSLKVGGRQLGFGKAGESQPRYPHSMRRDPSNSSGEVTPQPLSANLAVKFDGIDLKAVQPYIAQHTSMTLLSGRLGGDAKVRYDCNQARAEVDQQHHHRRPAHRRQCAA